MDDLETQNGDPHSGDPAPDEQPDRLAQAVSVEERPRLDFPVVGIGASAGGLEAFIEFFDVMPSDVGMAFVLVQHLSPDRESMVAEILAKHTKMSVVEVEDGMTVAPDHVYVIRPAHTMTLHRGKLHLGHALADPGHNRPVDDFFRSLAEEQRERSIAIIMSGMGSNGTAGAAEIKTVGGLVIAQDPESAKFPSMPRHLIESGNADFVLRPDEMPAVLQRYSAHAYVRGGQLAEAAERLDSKALTEILASLRVGTRRDFTGYKKPTVLRRIQRRMGLNQIESLADYASYLRLTPAEAPLLSDDLMIHVSGFFRDAEAWNALAERVIKPLIAGRSSDEGVRCWVTACSSGEEAYSLAMLITEAIEEFDKSLDVKIFATDMAERTLAKARAGLYPGGIEAQILPQRLNRFFDRDDSMYRIKKELREMVVFAPQNVIQDPPFSKLDICTCRNLLIYLEPDLQRRVLGLLHFGLRDGGALFLGGSETVAGFEEMFQPIDKRTRIFRRIGPARHEGEFTFPRRDEPAVAAAPRNVVPRLSIAQLTQRLLLARHAPAAVTVDREQRIVYFHGDTTAYLLQPSGEPTRDLLSVARDHVRGSIRAALQQATANNSRTACRDVSLETDEGRFRIEVVAEPLDLKLQPGYFLVSFHRLKELPPPVEVPSADRDVADLQSELNRVRDELQSTVEELQTTNEEMHASSEEAMSINEELQSTNEELETSKEELQSLNEELTTLNVQLQIKIEEHEALAADLNSLLSSTNIAVIFLDPQFRIRRYTPTVGDLIELIPSDVGRPLADLKLKFDDPTLLADCQAVLDKLTPAERQVATSSGKVYMRRVQPYRTTDNRIDGIVITFIDVSALNRAETSQRQTESRFRQVIEGARDFAMLLMDPQGKIVTWNAGAERLLGWTRDEAIGKSASMIYVGDDAEAQQGREMEKAIRDGRAEDETWHQRKDRTRIWGSGVLTALHDDAGQLTGFVKVLRDDTARRDAETDRDQLLIREQSARKEAEQASYVKDQFLARLSHELRTPLSSILTWSEMLQHGSMGPDETVEGLRVIERSALSQAQLLNDLLEVSRIASGKMRLERSETKLPALVRLAVEALKPIAEERGVTLEMNLQPDGCQLRADPDRLRQVVSNLLTNSVKFTPSGGRVTVAVSRTDDICEIRVTDTGQGIDPEFLPHIFTPFSQGDFTMTRSYGGLGLGLSISKELVELHGGTIEAHSEGAGRGATFIVRLPASMPASEPENAEEADGEPDANSLQETKILLVEDEPLTLDSLARVLRNYGADVTTAATAEAAFEAFNASPPHVIISDVGLPREDGYQLLQRLRGIEQERGLPPTPAIALSAFAGVKHRRQAREAGFDKHLPKPTKVAQLVNAISQLLAAPDNS